MKMCVCYMGGSTPDRGMGERTRGGWEETGSRDEGMDRDEPTSECVEGVRLIRWYGEGHPEGSVCAGHVWSGGHGSGPAGAVGVGGGGTGMNGWSSGKLHLLDQKQTIPPLTLTIPGPNMN